MPGLWAILILRKDAPGFWSVYASSFVFWLVSIWWISCPHPLTSLGLVALSAYLALYWPLFFATARVAVHRFRVPVILAAPVCWVGCEFLRNHLLGGFSFCALEHALYKQPYLIQMADIAGQYTVGAMVVLTGTGLGAALIRLRKRQTGLAVMRIVKPVLFFAILIGAAVYSTLSLTHGLPFLEDYPILKIAALQGNVPVQLGDDGTLARRTMEQYRELQVQAVMKAEHENLGKLDLIVWPETVCAIPNLVFAGKITPADIGWDSEIMAEMHNQLQNIARLVDTPTLFGLSTYLYKDDIAQTERLNSALLVDPRKDEVVARYDKVHLVMFGEYIPFARYLPDNFFLKTLCQEAGRGKNSVAMPIGENWLAPNICFESSVPHFIRNQVLTLKKEGREPQFLVNMSNDGWFRFSQQIDQHLAANVFRAIENRKPLVTATNGGFSAIVNQYGEITAIGKRGAAEAVVGSLILESWTSPYHRVGDWPAAICAFFMGITLCLGWKKPKKLKNM